MPSVRRRIWPPPASTRPMIYTAQPTTSARWGGGSGPGRPGAPPRRMIYTAQPTTSARWWRCSCAGRSGSRRPGRAVSSLPSDSRTRSWREGALVKIQVVVNGRARDLEIDAHTLLLDVLREDLDLKGAKRSCDTQVCGACTVLADGLAVGACTDLAVDADGRSVLTVEGLAEGELLHPLQRAFVDAGAVQCGFCTSGM